MFTHRLDQVKNVLKNQELDACLIEEVTDIFYLTGRRVSQGKILISTENESVFIVDGRYIEACSDLPFLKALLLKEKILSSLLKEKKIKNLGFCQEITTYQYFCDLEKIKDEINRENPLAALKLTPIENPLKWIRAIKDSNEIELLKKAADLGKEGFEFVLSCLKEGVIEKQVAIDLDIFWKRRGGDLAFEPIIAFGHHTSMPHYRSGEVPLRKGDTVLIDIGVKLDQYHSDMTRTLFFGTPNPKILKIYEIVKIAQERAMESCRAGITIGDLDQVARNIIQEAGFGEQFSHGLGHGIGLEIHEAPGISQKSPNKDMPLKAGMAITIEPGIYLPHEGGVRIEDSVIVTNEGCEDLTKIDKEPLILEPK